jgi:hypothetical protein
MTYRKDSKVVDMSSTTDLNINPLPANVENMVSFK